MAICQNCGSEIAENVAFCSACGAKVQAAEPQQPAPENPQAQYYQQPQGAPAGQYYQQPQGAPAQSEAEFSQEDIKNNKAIAAIAYIGLLFLVPLLAGKDSKFARFHANQGIVLFIFDFIVGLLAIIPVLGWVAMGVGYVFSIVCAIIGIINACKGEAKPLPLIGKFNILN